MQFHIDADIRRAASYRVLFGHVLHCGAAATRAANSSTNRARVDLDVQKDAARKILPAGIFNVSSTILKENRTPRDNIQLVGAPTNMFIATHT